MGCDIHLWVEQRCKVNPHPDDPHEWESCGFYGEFCSRVYGMFARMACVRSYRGAYQIQFEPRGFPNDISWLTGYLCYLHVTKDGYPAYSECNNCSKEDAERWVKEGYSKWVNEEHTTVTNPDYHSYSWLTTQELRQCFDDCFKQKDGTYCGGYIDWLGLISLCEGIESDGKHECRVVFTFDN